MQTELYQKRRKAFQSQMEPQGTAIFFSAPLVLRSNDVHYTFRQDSDFHYLTGCAEEEAILVLKNEEEILYLEERNPEKEIWDGRRLGTARAIQELGVEQAKASSVFLSDIKKILVDMKYLYYRFGTNSEHDKHILGSIRKLLEQKRNGKDAPSCIINSDTILHEMRMFKSKTELEILKENAVITSKGHTAIMQKTHPGQYEYELEAILEHTFRSADACQAYPPIVASGPNACTLHYTQNNRQLQKDELILVDAGAEKNHLAIDVTRTFPTGKKFRPMQKAVYEIVLEAQKTAIEKNGPGSSLDIIHDTATFCLIEGLIELKVLSGKAMQHFEKAKEIEEQSNPQKLKEIPYRRYYMHRTSHWLGMDVHDVGPYYRNKEPIQLKEGMVFTIEPGLYFSPQDETISTELRGIGIRIEDDIYVQKKNFLVLTKAIPKEVIDIENLRSKALQTN